MGKMRNKKFRSRFKKAKPLVRFRPSAAKEFGQFIGFIAGMAEGFNVTISIDEEPDPVTEDADFEVIKPKLLNNANEGRK